MTQNLVVGTAGHIDHGKTALIRALTGRETDRLPEEQRRGISIDLGFAHMELAEGKTVSFVDVPGHERFIKNMVAGVTGMDAVLLLVAADEGIMPQTREHLDIVSLLGVRTGIVVLSKVDLVWPEWLEEMRLEVREGLKGSFLEDAPMVETSATTGQGLDQLRDLLALLEPSPARRRAAGPARLPVDRVFSVPGFGTVVTGTLVSGTISVGDMLEVLPGGHQVRVRGLQVHGQTAQSVSSGRRTAVNLSGLSGPGIERGVSLCSPGEFLSVRGFGASLRLLSHLRRPLDNNARVRIHTGTVEVLGRVLLLETEELRPGDQAYVHLRTEDPVVVAPGDRYIIRTYSPMHTIGGGPVLDIYRRYRRGDKAGVRELELREKGKTAEVVEAVLKRAGPRPLSVADVIRRLGRGREETERLLEEMSSRGEAFLLEDLVLGSEGLDQLRSRVLTALADHHRRFPLRPGMPKAELRQRVLPGSQGRAFQPLLCHLEKMGHLRERGDLVWEAEFSPRLSPEQEKKARQILDTLNHRPFDPPPAQQDWSEELLKHLELRGDLVVMSRDLVFSSQALQRAREQMVAHLEGSKEGMTVAEFRDLLGTSRRYALALLNYFDQKGITRRDGDHRFLRTRRDKE